MKINSFENNIDSRILNRGESYFQESAVEELVEVGGNKWQAQVDGSELYDVEVEINKNTIDDWSCTCPYDWGPICKHVVATLFAIRAELNVEKSKRPQKSKSRKKQKTDWQQAEAILDKLSKAQITAYFTSHILQSRRQLNAFLAHFGEENEDAGLDFYKKMIRRFARSAGDKHGFINYYSARAFDKDVDDLLQSAEKYFVEGKYQRGIWICMAAIEAIPDIILNMDDSDGGPGTSFSWAINMIFENSAALPVSLQNELFTWLKKEYPKKK